MLQSVIIDDEIWARKKIKTFIEDLKTIEVIAEASNGKSAIRLIKKLKPDLIFLDIQMPLMNGFEMLSQLDIKPMPMIIFTTAHEQHAIKAFEAHAIDYLLKPYDRERFIKSIEHVQSLRNSEGKIQIEEKLNKLIEAAVKPQQKIAIKHNGSIYLIQHDEIQWIEAYGNYIRIKTSSEYLYRETIQAMIEKLNQTKFIRVHRSSIVNSDFIKKLVPGNPNEFEIMMIDGKKIRSSRTYRKNLDRLLS